MPEDSVPETVVTKRCHGIIYLAINKGDGKKYVGQTRLSLKRRLAAHVARSPRSGEYFPKALAKHGKNAFEYHVIDIGSCAADLNDKEKKWIKILNCKAPNGYNMTDGGQTLSDRAMDTKGEKNANFGKKHPGLNAGEKNPMFGKKCPWTADRNKKQIGAASPTHGKVGSMNGRTHTPETRPRLSAALKGKRTGPEHHMWGKKRSPETLRKMAEWRANNPHPLLGTKLSNEHKRKVSEALRGEKHPNFGKVMTTEQRAKIAKALTGRVGTLRGREFTDEHRKRISESHKGLLAGEKHPNWGKPLSESIRMKISAGNKGRKHSPETRAKMSESQKRRAANVKANGHIYGANIG